MATVTRGLPGSKTHSIALYIPKAERDRFGGRKQIWKTVGPDKRDAERLGRQQRQALREGTFDIKTSPTMRVDEWLVFWLDWRKTLRRNSTDDARNVHRFLIDDPARAWLRQIRLENLEAPHSNRLVEELKLLTHSKTGLPLAEKYVANVFGVWSSAIGEAVARGLVRSRDVLRLSAMKLKRTADEHLTPPYTAEEIRALLGPTPGEPMTEAQAYSALLLLTGQREGEAAGRRWSDIADADPMPSLHVWCQYDDRPLKTMRGKPNLKVTKDKMVKGARLVPMIDRLLAALTRWRDQDFAHTYARRPRPDDHIVPRTFDAEGRSLPHTKSSAYKLWRAGCVAAGVDNRGLHLTRHTFISHCVNGGGDQVKVEKATHNKRGETIENYTHRNWPPLCEAVECLDREISRVISKTPKRPAKWVEAPGIELDVDCDKTRKNKHERAQSTARQTGQNCEDFLIPSQDIALANEGVRLAPGGLPVELADRIRNELRRRDRTRLNLATRWPEHRERILSELSVDSRPVSNECPTLTIAEAPERLRSVPA